MSSEPLEVQHLTMQHVVDIPHTAGRCMGITTFRGRVLIATEYGGVFEVEYDFFTHRHTLVSIGPPPEVTQQNRWAWDADGREVEG